MSRKQSIETLRADVGLTEQEQEKLGFTRGDLVLLADHVRLEEGAYRFTMPEVDRSGATLDQVLAYFNDADKIRRYMMYRAKRPAAKSKPKKKVEKKVHVSDPDGLFGFMHQSMMGKFWDWIDEICLGRHGFRYSELVNMEKCIARLHTAAEGGSAEADAECAKLTKEYREIWLPRRYKMMGI